jgi:hypothetical protein
MTLISTDLYVILSPSAEPQVPSEAEGLRTFGSVKDPYDEAPDVVKSQGFFAPIGAQNDINSC